MAATVTLATMRRHVQSMTGSEAVRSLAAAYERGDTEAATAITRALPTSAHAEAEQLWRLLDVVRVTIVYYSDTWQLLNSAARLAEMVAQVGGWAASMGTDFANIAQEEDTPERIDFLQVMIDTSDTMALIGTSWVERHKRETSEAAADLAGLNAYMRDRWGVDALRTLEGASVPADPNAPRLQTPEQAAGVMARLRTTVKAIIDAGAPDAAAIDTSREQWAAVAARVA